MMESIVVIPFGTPAIIAAVGWFSCAVDGESRILWSHTYHIYIILWGRAFRCNSGAQWWNQSRSISHFKTKIDRTLHLTQWWKLNFLLSLDFSFTLSFVFHWSDKRCLGRSNIPSSVYLATTFVFLNLNHPSNAPNRFSLYNAVFVFCTLFTHLESLFFFLVLPPGAALGSLKSSPPHRTTTNQEGENGGIKDQKKCSSCKRRHQTEDLCQFISQFEAHCPIHNSIHPLWSLKPS